MQIKHCVWDFHLACHPLLKTLMQLANTSSHLLTVSYKSCTLRDLTFCLSINLINTCRFFTTRPWCLCKPWFYDCSLLWRVARTKLWPLPQSCWNYRVHWEKSFTRIHGKSIALKFNIFNLLKRVYNTHLFQIAFKYNTRLMNHRARPRERDHLISQALNLLKN